jgi:hypothetical protein
VQIAESVRLPSAVAEAIAAVIIRFCAPTYRTWYPLRRQT